MISGIFVDSEQRWMEFKGAPDPAKIPGDRRNFITTLIFRECQEVTEFEHDVAGPGEQRAILLCFVRRESHIEK
jgi:hypothetical protein